MFKRLGLGLGASGKYERAFEKGVLLGDFETATSLFRDAAREFEKKGNVEGQVKALANANLYDYIQSGKPQILDSLIEHLSQISEIECIGSATETMPAGPLLAELKARKAEIAVERLGIGTSNEALASAHEQARISFEPIMSEKLVTYRYLVKDQFKDSAESRYYYHAGKACWHRAQAKAAATPAEAADEMSQAVMYYRRAGYDHGEQVASRALTNLRLERTCWVCDREMQGQGINFEYLPSRVTPYHLAQLEKANQDRSSLDLEKSQVALCVVCRGLIDNLAQTIANEVATQKLSSIEDQMKRLTQRIHNLERTAHGR